jgi:hypothetical protein
MNSHRKPHADMSLDAVSHLNPGWRCWRESTPMNGWYYAEHEGYGRVDAADPEDLHTAILIAESGERLGRPGRSGGRPPVAKASSAGRGDGAGGCFSE